jgi:Putative zinc-finger
MDCKSIEPALPAAAAGALDPEEQQAVHRHIVVCSPCAHVVRSYEDTLALLAYAVPQVRPAASVRIQILAGCGGLANPGRAE